MAIAFVGYLIGFSIFAFGLVLAPDWTFLTVMIYLPLPCLSVPLAIVAVSRKWIRLRGAILGLAIAAGFFVFYLTLIGSGMPGGGTYCQPIESTLPEVRYSCIDTSSDDPSYRYEFELEGWAGWPVMRLAHPDPQ